MPEGDKRNAKETKLYEEGFIQLFIWKTSLVNSGLNL
jgi:hypothetical protein